MQRKFLWIMGVIIVVLAGAVAVPPQRPLAPHIPQPLWSIRSIDTMKSSRDLAQAKGSDEAFGAAIEQEVKNIAETGATHVAIGTPYDAEFVPFMTRWVATARKYGLKVWFRGNMAGWEEWFGYRRMSPSAHTQQVVSFIKSNTALFENGDLFSSCPECENGALGDPRTTGRIKEYREFLITEHAAVQQAFTEINKQVDIRFYSMNYDVATAIMDHQTTSALGGIVTIDHYVADPLKISRDAATLAEKSGGRIFLGEWGAPIPDLNGEMSESEQAKWIEQALGDLKNNRSVMGVNYWTSTGGTTALWHTDFAPKQAVSVITQYFHMKI